MVGNELHYKTVEMMEEYGGSFVKALANAFRHADLDNTIKLKRTFSDYYDQYQEMAGKN